MNDHTTDSDMDDMYMDYQGSESLDGEKTATMSDTGSFRSAQSIVGDNDLNMDVDVEEDDGSSPGLAMVFEQTKSKARDNDLNGVNEITANPIEPTRKNKENRNPDLMCDVNGMYRILDLVSEQGSGGLGMSFELYILPISPDMP